MPEIAFRVASIQSATKASSADYKTEWGDVPFGAYAWYKSETPGYDTEFMINQKVSYDSGKDSWAPYGETYYWPRSGSLDFICYSPWSATPPEVHEDRIILGPWAPGSGDLMYADKAEGLSGNLNTYYYTGVPVLFHHALSRLSFSIRLAYSEAVTGQGDKTRWEVDITGARLRSVESGGSLTLTLDGDSWALPGDKVWTPTGDRTDLSLDLEGGQAALADTGEKTLAEGILVQPQALSGTQILEMVLTIRTYMDKGDGYGSTPLLTEKDVIVSTTLRTASLGSWAVNQHTVYHLLLTPSLESGSAPLQPEVIRFDPAVNGWDTVTVSTEIKF